MDDRSRKLQTYQHFGLRKEWLAGFLSDPQDWISKCQIGPRQFDSALQWLRHAELIEGPTRSPVVTPLGSILTKHGADSMLTWSVIWANLARNSAVVNWYLSRNAWGATFEKSELVEWIASDYPLSDSTRGNAIMALMEILQKSPLGEGLGMAHQTSLGKRSYFVKVGWESPIPVAVLYSLYRYAERIGRHELTVRELFDRADEGPHRVFGIEADDLRGILRGLSQETDMIRTDIVHDLDSIYLDTSRTAVEVIGLA